MHVVESFLKGDNDPGLIDVWLTEGIAEAVSGGTVGGSITDLAKMNELQEIYGYLNPIKMHQYNYPNIDMIIFYPLPPIHATPPYRSSSISRSRH